MNPSVEIAAFLLVAFVGAAVAIDCYDGLDFVCSGDETLCDVFKQSFLAKEPTKTNCGPDVCLLSYTSVSTDSLTMTSKYSMCAGGAIDDDIESRCYGRDELEALNPDMAGGLEQQEEAIGLKYDDAGLCICDTNLCNGVSRSTATIAVVAALLLVAIGNMIV